MRVIAIMTLKSLTLKSPTGLRALHNSASYEIDRCDISAKYPNGAVGPLFGQSWPRNAT